MPDLNELLSRVCHEAGGTKVINCVIHMGLELDERPRCCQLCFVDIQNRLSDAIAVNGWLNQWKDDASELLRARPARNCAGEILDTESDDRTATKPCPRPAEWIKADTGSPFCGVHKDVIERAFPPEEGGPTFRPFDCHDAQEPHPMPKACAGGVPPMRPFAGMAVLDTVQPCPAAAVWICEQTEAPYCGAHRQEIELIDHSVTFRPVEATLPAVRNPRAYAWIAGAIGNLSLAVSEFADEGQTQHVTVGDSILDQLTELYKAVTK